MEYQKIKITFGIQPKQIERIEEVIKYWDNTRTEEDKEVLKDGWILYDRNIWIDLGKEFGWEPLTLALYYFKYKNKNS
ncbi:Uncharacterised protein [Chryseobacterium nakagawai]|uniref:Uncharacterized protein n=1 Tax=Chryseobacterium nakagawai TaxID=1241982 RepID=A0AAD1DR66_CHRNA|nr:hypothetical protein [Chryseobacterium nakagawai]AZA91145.1 hypothetical protein EG343_11140 [Chryseobacterium nakagawai]VEH22705.1 Uncharacterised protein [Chryseobacterium nakagawai]